MSRPGREPASRPGRDPVSRPGRDPVSHPAQGLTGRIGQGPTGRLTGRGGVTVVFGTCFLGLLLADWAHWAELADAVFFMASSLTAYYVRPGSLLPVAVSPPLLFFGAAMLEKTVTASGMLGAFEEMLATLDDAAWWLFAGTALTVAIALVRGLRHEIAALVLELRVR